MNAVRQAAILVSALDMDAADALLEQMPADFAEAVRACVMELDDIEAQEEKSVIDRFLGREAESPQEMIEDSLNDPPHELAVSLEDYLLRQPIGDHETQQAATQPLNSAPHKTTDAPLSFLHEASNESLYRTLKDEHPQTVALVLSHLESEQAAAVLAQLSPALQVDVARRMVALDDVDQQTLREVSEGLRYRIVPRRAAGGQVGLNAIRKIVSAKDEASETILTNLRQSDARLAEQLDTTPSQHNASQRETVTPPRSAQRLAASPMHLEFNDLTQLSDDDLGQVLRKAEGRVLLLALAGASPSLMAKVYRQLPKADAAALRRQIEQQGTIRLRDVEEAQRRIGLIAGELAIAGEIQSPPARRFAVAA